MGKKQDSNLELQFKDVQKLAIVMHEAEGASCMAIEWATCRS